MGTLQGFAAAESQRQENQVELSEHLKGLAFMLSSMALTAFKWSLIQFMTQRSRPGSYLALMSKMQLAARVQPITGLMCLLLAFFFEFDSITTLENYQWHELLRVPAMGLLITFITCSELKLVQLTSAVATGILMNLHHIPMVVAGIVLFGDKVAAKSIEGFALCLMGGFVYAAARYYDSKPSTVNH